jgi:hypothetical protein
MPLRGTVQNMDLTTSGDWTYPSTEDSAERGFTAVDPLTSDPVTYRTLGRAEGLGDDGAGDIADEGRGHRG